MGPMYCKPLILRLGFWVAMVISGCASALGLGIDRQHFVDDTGATVVLRGYNFQAKAPPFQPIQEAQDLDPLWAMGANFIRFNFVWEAAEPLPGVYDQAYFD